MTEKCVLLFLITRMYVITIVLYFISILFSSVCVIYVKGSFISADQIKKSYSDSLHREIFQIFM